MKQINKIHIKTNIFIFMLIWLVRTFIYWQIINPFDWIINLPYYTTCERFLIVVSMVLYYGYSRLFIYIYLDSKKPL